MNIEPDHHCQLYSVVIFPDMLRYYQEGHIICCAQIFPPRVGDSFGLSRSDHHNKSRDRFVKAPSQWKTTLPCNVISHWPCAFTKWSLKPCLEFEIFHKCQRSLWNWLDLNWMIFGWDIVGHCFLAWNHKTWCGWVMCYEEKAILIKKYFPTCQIC